MCFEGSDVLAEMRSVESLHQFEGNRYCFKGPNVFRDLPTLTSPAFFGLDEIHLLGHDIHKQLYIALGSKFQISSEIAHNEDQQQQQQQQEQQQQIYTFSLNVPIAKIDNAISKSRADIPAIFTGSWRSLEETTGRQKAVNWLDFLLFVVPTVVVKNFVLSNTREVVMNLVNACSIAQQWKLFNHIYKSITHWHSFLRNEIEEKRLKPTIFIINQHMLVHLEYIMREMGTLRAFSCRLIEPTIGLYRTAIRSRKKSGKNMDNILFCKAGIQHCLRGRSAVLRPTNRKTSNFEVAIDDVAGPQLWSSPTRMSLGAVARETGINHNNLVGQIASLWGQDNQTLFAENEEHLCGAWASNEEMFPVWESQTIGEMKMVEVKSIRGMAGLVHNINNETIRHVVFPHPRHYE
ncbi:hypothetical protein PHYBLDRAFT_150641 [Phycomyces blakesleeanus NRRL 1555(-)]|uniref:DUF4218 domain-containing protein n=1 Tax=Phycomyces blakesleeanus (strain ATCC 8743b / DSM 1359 / FGSC 10004 / NBRC 33097 / NRRL 1555) TaxID=763407 RepID=A0A163D3L1_PHYB8|nr:hypothetical protein PHYBLDRAFT_150641 [Phycomyces blakesleeanus NRRL 1555(-)]OAD68470.1 hypothetical protein PHYBLDRAFT_150641 [Phycomyces blakesleeanus NRRL 1555(-)]|eukprot:XP_018286510.1 hypothetical protein PHYBLDRAFT_150641 [Phycomyces blakesleeanus NRRL 1555(-)]